MREFFLWLAIAFTGAVCFGYDWGRNSGDGSVGSPYEINKPEQLISLGTDPNLLQNHFILMNDIHFDPPVNGSNNFQCIGTRDVPFSGTFNGNNKTIWGLVNTNNTIPYAGLFGAIIGEDAVVKDLTLNNVHIGSSGSQVGALAGYVEKGTIQHCSVNNGDITGDEGVGGFIGWMSSGSVQDCSFSGTCRGDNMVGGFIGRYGAGGIRYTITGSNVNIWYWIANSTGENVREILRCEANASVFGTVTAGGFSGYCSQGNIQACKTTATIYGHLEHTGTGMNAIGGFTGGAGTCYIEDCYATVKILSTEGASGFCGLSFQISRINRCYCSGTIEGNKGWYEYGFCQNNAGNAIIQDCYYSDSLPYDYEYATQLTHAEMRQQAPFVDWDFSNIWRMCADGISRPRLEWESSRSWDIACPDGVGLEDLVALGQCWLDENTVGCDRCDLDGNTYVDLTDIAVISQHWLDTLVLPDEPVLIISVPEKGPNPAPYIVNLMNMGEYDANYTITNTPTASSWLDITPGSGTLLSNQSTSLTIGIDVIGPDLEPGLYEAAYHIFSEESYNSPQTGRILLEVVDRYPELSLDQQEFSITARETGPNPDPQTIVVTNSGNQDADYVIEYPGGQPAWLDVSQAVGTIIQGSQLNLSVSIDVIGSGLEPGDYEQDILLVCPEDPESPYVITIELNVQPLGSYPFLSIDPFPETIYVNENGPNPESVELWLFNGGYQDIEFTVEYPGGQPAWLSLTPAEGIAPKAEDYDPFSYIPLSLSVDVLSNPLEPGFYEQQIYIYENGLQVNPNIIFVSMHVIDQYPEIEVWPYSASFSATEGGPNPSPKALRIDNRGTETSHFTIEYPDGQPAWLDISPASGGIDPMESFSLSVTADVVGSGLTAGTYTTVFQIVDPKSLTSPLEVTVSLQVN